MKTKTNVLELDLDIKIYKDGSAGNYMCLCCQCNKYFQGHKHDVLCGECSMQAGEELTIIAEEE